MKTSTSPWSFVRTYCAIIAGISLLAIYQTQAQTQALFKLSTRYKWVILMVVFALNAIAGLYVALRRQSPRRPTKWLDLPTQRGILGSLAGVCLILLPVPFLLYMRADFFGRGGEAFFRLLWLFWWMALLQAAGLKLLTKLDWPHAFMIALLSSGIAAQLYTLSTAISGYPFSMGWSEASRYYYGSLLFSKSIYGVQVPLSVMHGTRYLLQSVPFALPGMTLWGARFWQVLLWVCLTGASAWATIRRVVPTRAVDAALAIGWLFLYFFQGAVYYHLQVCVIIIMLGVSSRHPVRSLLAIVAASIWAGMSRVNWFPVPAILGIALYILEHPYSEARGIWHYARMPALWAIAGVASALAGQALYVAISGNTNLEAFASSFTSALLWYRWWPSATNPIGIVPGTAIVSFPLLALILWRMRTQPGTLHWLRLTALVTMLTLLLVGGLVVSTKIGGGGDLHNMDAYMVLLSLLGAYFGRGAVSPERRFERAAPAAPWSIAALVVTVPVAFSLLRMASPFRYDAAAAAADLGALQQEIGQLGTSGEVLFMYERQLLTFGMVPKVDLVPEDEVVTLMEMAISGNEAYLHRYYSDLKSHRFSAIVAHPQNLGVETGDFIEENDAWNRLVAQPLLCNYKPLLTLNYSKIQILVPRARACPDPAPDVQEP